MKITVEPSYIGWHVYNDDDEGEILAHFNLRETACEFLRLLAVNWAEYVRLRYGNGSWQEVFEFTDDLEVRATWVHEQPTPARAHPSIR